MKHFDNRNDCLAFIGRDVLANWQGIIRHAEDPNANGPTLAGEDLERMKRITADIKSVIPLIEQSDELLLALKALADQDNSYFGTEIRIGCANHGDAIG
ncbi:MAG: hypothetical protein HQ492_00030, partial [Woeseiaceae bacterium]|nr:hypothetical protein [Woeseiaceae bacterium]